LIQLIYPQVQEFLKAYPNTKIKTIDISPDVYDAYFKDDWLEKPASALVHGYFSPSNFSFYANRIMHADEPSHGLIVGVDKPRLLLEDGKYYSTVVDKTMEVFISAVPNLELFYYAPDMPKIHVKQAWMLLNHIERNYGKLIYTPEQIDPLLNTMLGSSPTSFTITETNDQKNTNTITSEFLRDYCGNSHSKYYDDFCIACGRGAAWNVNLSIQNGKSKYKHNGREPALQKGLRDALDDKWKSAHNFVDAMDHLKKDFSHIFNNSDPYCGTIGIYSKKYYMKDAN